MLKFVWNGTNLWFYKWVNVGGGGEVHLSMVWELREFKIICRLPWIVVYSEGDKGVGVGRNLMRSRVWGS